MTTNYDIIVESAYHGYPDEKISGGRKVVLNNVDLKVRAGEFLTMVGPSGCGKSTLLRLITGQEQVNTALQFQIMGGPAGFPDRRRGVVFQNYTLAPHLTVLGNILLSLKYQADPWRELWSPKWNRQAKLLAEEYLKKIRLVGAGDKYPHELSGGMKQRVAIAQTLVTIDLFEMPKVLCMDEPYGALDPSTREELQVFILELWEKYKTTVIFVTHDIEEAVFLGSRIITLSQFWQSDISSDSIRAGARIVFDQLLPRQAFSTKVKTTPEFTAMVAKVLEQGFRPEHRIHVSKFNLSHPDSFQTLSTEEDPQNGKFSEVALNGHGKPK